jgi:hypothetical protein
VHVRDTVLFNQRPNSCYSDEEKGVPLFV